MVWLIICCGSPDTTPLARARAYFSLFLLFLLYSLGGWRWLGSGWGVVGEVVGFYINSTLIFIII